MLKLGNKTINKLDVKLILFIISNAIIDINAPNINIIPPIVGVPSFFLCASSK